MYSKRSISGRVGAITAGLILLFSLNLAAQYNSEPKLPGWVLFQKGLSSYDKGDLDLALEFFTRSAGNGVLTPEAIYWIGKVYEEEGDLLLAEERYLEAMEDARFLYVPEDKWLIQYSLAGIYLNRKEYEHYEQLLLSIFDEEMIRNAEVVFREHAYVQMLKEKGLDKLLLLYRIRLSYSLEAAEQLGVYYARSTVWKSSLIKNLYAVLSGFSGGIEYLIEMDQGFSFPVNMEEAWERDDEFLISLYEEYATAIDPEFSYKRDLKTLEAMQILDDTLRAEKIIHSRNPSFAMTASLYTLRKMEKQSALSSLMKDGKLYRALFFLAQSLYHEGFPERADEVWTLVSLSGRESSWKTLSLKALSDPELQPASLIY
ncbi:MAG: hypothetical protein B6241_09040 [Spirochaetaceae bacterium 4572_59]|nr:MAG: hypothetical protein B6241_09040 [Spirochaetaceae bacterium 4572_59]